MNSVFSVWRFFQINCFSTVLVAVTILVALPMAGCVSGPIVPVESSVDSAYSGTVTRIFLISNLPKSRLITNSFDEKFKSSLILNMQTEGITVEVLSSQQIASPHGSASGRSSEDGAYYLAILPGPTYSTVFSKAATTQELDLRLVRADKKRIVWRGRATVWSGDGGFVDLKYAEALAMTITKKLKIDGMLRPTTAVQH